MWVISADYNGPAAIDGNVIRILCCPHCGEKMRGGKCEKCGWKA